MNGRLLDCAALGFQVKLFGEKMPSMKPSKRPLKRIDAKPKGTRLFVLYPEVSGGNGTWQVNDRVKVIPLNASSTVQVGLGARGHDNQLPIAPNLITSHAISPKQWKLMVSPGGIVGLLDRRKSPNTFVNGKFLAKKYATLSHRDVVFQGNNYPFSQQVHPWIALVVDKRGELDKLADPVKLRSHLQRWVRLSSRLKLPRAPKAPAKRHPTAKIR